MLQSSKGAGQRPTEFTSREKAYRQRLGERGYERFETLKKQERQRVWDNMRRIAAARYRDGLMPPWFKSEWLDIEEAPTNTWWRHQGLSVYQNDTTWLGDNAPDSGSGGSSGNGGEAGGSGSNGNNNGIWPRWWREEDPYWPLRDWGDHPMRWWTWGLAGIMAAGGVLMHSVSGDPTAVFLGFGSAALLGMAAVAMSDMEGTAAGTNVLGELGVKAAFAVCAILAWNEFSSLQGLQPQQQQQQLGSWSQRQQQQYWNSSSSPGFKGTGWACLCMALMYMYTGMSGLAEYSLPTNPGEAFRMVDIAEKHKVWDYWGYGSLTMRG